MILMSVEVEGVDEAQVGVDVLVHHPVVALADLPQAGEAGADRVAAVVLGRVVAGDDRGELRARADQRHVAAHDVDQLGELVEGQLAQPAPDPGEPGVAGVLVGLAAVLAVEGGLLAAAVGVHRAELHDGEGPAAVTDALLAQEDRAAQAHARTSTAHMSSSGTTTTSRMAAPMRSRTGLA